MPTLLLQREGSMQAWDTEQFYGARQRPLFIRERHCRFAMRRPWTATHADMHITSALGNLIPPVRIDCEGEGFLCDSPPGKGVADPYKGYLQADGNNVDNGTIISNRSLPELRERFGGVYSRR